MVDDARDGKSTPRQKQGLFAFRIGKLDPVPHLPAHLLRQVLLHSARTGIRRQLAFHQERTVDTLGEGGGVHALASGPAGHPDLGHDDAFRVPDAFDPPQDIHILLG